MGRRVLDGLDWVFKAKNGGRLRLPCTLDVLVRILATKGRKEQTLPEDGRPSVYSMESFTMSAAVYTLAFCGAFRPSEISVRVNQAKAYTSLPLRIKHISIEFEDQARQRPVRLIIWLPKRKNDQLGEKSDVAVGLTGDDLVCAVQRVVGYLAARQAAGEVLTDESLLFPVDKADGSRVALTYDMLTSAMDVDLAAAGFDAKLYNGHSWRIGHATTLALNGVPEYISTPSLNAAPFRVSAHECFLWSNFCPTHHPVSVKDMGGWSRTSSAFNTYIHRCPQGQRAAFTAFLTRPYVPVANAPPAGFFGMVRS